MDLGVCSRCLLLFQRLVWWFTACPGIASVHGRGFPGAQDAFHTAATVFDQDLISRSTDSFMPFVSERV